MNRKYNLKLDLQFRCNNSIMKFNQFDNNTSDFFIRITNSGNLVDIEKAIVVLAVIKPSGKVSSQFIEVKNGLVYVDLKPNMRDEIGTYTAKAMLILEDERVVTDVISYKVEEDKIFSLLNDSVEDTEEFTLLTDMLSRLSNIEQQEEQRMINEAERILSEENRKIEESKRVEAELIRQHEEADRTKYDAIRESNENIRKINEEARISSENVRLENEANRIEQEANRVKAEQLRKDNYNLMTEDEERRRSEANAHKEAEVLRVQAETNRVNEEAKRRTTEQARVSAENTRVGNENTRKANETTRQTNETQRVEAETQRQNRYNSFITDAEANANDFENYTNTAKAKEEERKSNELDRRTQEAKRVSNEVERISNENTRKVSENARIESEKQRVDAENLRKEKIIEIQSDYDSLKKVIIDENVSANLQNQINQTNSQLEHKANKGEIGSPLVASSTEMMEDTSKVYVNTTDSKWYSYNGTNWVAGGLYNSQGIGDQTITPNKTTFINIRDNNIINEYIEFSDGYLNLADGTFVSAPNFKTTDFIKLEKNIAYVCEYSGYPKGQTSPVTYPRGIIMYNSDKTFSRSLNLPADMTNGRLICENDETYIRINAYPKNDILKVYPKEEGHIIDNVLENVKIEYGSIINAPDIEGTIEKTIEGKLEKNKVKKELNFNTKPRKAVISFILDGEYEFNSIYEKLFYDNGIKIGIAPQYVTNFPNNSLETYLLWQDKGHEILSHLTYILRESEGYTENEANEIIENSYKKMTEYGFDIRGCVGSSGLVDDKYIDKIREYYNYGYTKYNLGGGGQSSENHLTPPYRMTRYSMEISTLEQMKLAVDNAILNNNILTFYGHARSSSIDSNMTVENIQELIDYIKSKKCLIETPYNAITYYYDIRYEDIF